MKGGESAIETEGEQGRDRKGEVIRLEKIYWGMKRGKKLEG